MPRGDLGVRVWSEEADSMFYAAPADKDDTEVPQGEDGRVSNAESELMPEEQHETAPSRPQSVDIEDSMFRRRRKVPVAVLEERAKLAGEKAWNSRHHVTASRSNERNSPFYREYFDKSPWDADPSRGDQLTHDDLMGSSIAPREPLPSRPSTAAASGVSRRTMKALEARDRAQKRAAERGWDNRFHVTLGNFANARLHHAHREYFEAPRVFDEGTKPVVPRAVDRVDSLVRPPSPRSGLGLQCIMDAGSVLGSVWSDATRSGRFDIDERGALVSREASRRQTTRRSRRSPRAKMWSEALPGEPPSRPRGAPRPTRAERRAEAERAMQDDAAQQLQLRVPAAAERVLRKKKVRERGWNDRCCTGTVTRDPVRIKLGLFKKGHRPLRDATAADLLRRPEPFDPDLMGHRRTRLSPRDGLRSIL